MFYVYVLQNLVDNNLYTGFTEDLQKRITEHNAKKVMSTAKRVPLKLIYCECSLDKKDALHREKYLKTTYGKRYLKNRLKNYLEHS
ncbi:MAG TPA: GIY-YIG nuclease family protein [Ignavibacteria bacterium]|nr:GIY-YIG nuclease family protein [Ignavibacteria bacterium]